MALAGQAAHDDFVTECHQEQPREIIHRLQVPHKNEGDCWNIFFNLNHLRSEEMMENRNVSNVGRDIAFLRLYESIVFFESMFGYALLVNSIKFCASIRKFMVNSEHRA